LSGPGGGKGVEKAQRFLCVGRGVLLANYHLAQRDACGFKLWDKC
jgi:hypothetical protein